MIIAIRIRGLVGVKIGVAETFDRIRLRRKFSCVLVNEKDVVMMGMLNKLKDGVAYGAVDEKTLTELIKARGTMKDKTEIKDPASVAKELMGGKKLEDLGLKPFFRLHPPRKGINSKLHYPRGVIGDNKEKINDLVMRML
jgi:large subunit ribosomal protein L30